MPRWTNEQLSAIKLSGQNIIVSAGAGSGKTAVLTQRVLEKIENGIHINELLILTFTKAAASEMKDRIRRKLNADPKYSEELKLLESSYITTFDSYALSIVKKYHYLLNISKDISICDESIIKLYTSTIIDNIFEELYSNHDSDFEYLINAYCNKNDKALRNNILGICETISGLLNYQEFINNINNYFFTDSSIEKIYSDYLKILEDKREELKLNLENFSYYFDSDTVEKFNDALGGILNCNVSDIYLYSSTTLPRVSKYPDDESKVVREELKSSLDELIGFSKYKDFDNIKTLINESSRCVKTIINIVLKYINELNEYKKLNNLYTFSDIAFLSIKVLKENSDACSEIKNSFKEIMIDEYQDTNDVQDTFIKLIENNNVYMVGDIKQSIYKFRGSNPNIFKEKYDSYSLNNGGMKIDLIKNFRSRSEVLDDINRIFELIMDNEIGGASYKESHEMVYGNTSYDEEKIKDFNYNASILEYGESDTFDNNEIEMFTIADDIKKNIDNHTLVFDKETSMLRECNYNDFVIILDRSKYFNDYKKVFEYMGIPLSILKDDSLTSNNDILLIKNLIELVIKIKNNDFDVSFKYDFVSVARSFLYEYSDNEIYDIVINNKYTDTSIFKDLSSISDINSRSINEIFIEILDKVKFYNCIYKVGNYNNIDVRLNTIYDLANSISNMGYDIYGFVDYLNNINNSDIDIQYTSFKPVTNSVKIMTIHGSKGLEYPFCYFADLDHKFNERDIKSKFIVSNTYGLIVDAEEEGNILKDLYKYQYRKEDISERLRLLYVALTRAREKITIVIPHKDTRKLALDESGLINKVYRLKINKLSEFIYDVKDYLSDYFSEVNLDSINLSKNYLLNKKTSKEELKSDVKLDVKEINIKSDIINTLHFSKEKLSVINSEEYSKLKYGTLVHSYLEYIDFKNKDVSFISDEFIRGKISKFLNNKLFDDKDSIIYKEYEFKYSLDNINYNGVIDLMIEYSNYIDIIDYKLKNIDDENYKKQLNGYKDYISSITDKKINLYLYSIIDEKLESL